MLIIFLINSSVRIDLGSIRRSCLCPVMSHTPYCTAVECQDRFIHALLIWHSLLTSYLLVHSQYSHLQDPTEQLHGSQACSHIRIYTVKCREICEVSVSDQVWNAVSHARCTVWMEAQVKHANIAIPLYIYLYTYLYTVYTLMMHSLCIMATWFIYISHYMCCN